MKINDLIYRYPSASLRGFDGICRLRTFINSKSELYITLTELENNTSASITNSIEKIYEDIIKKGYATTQFIIIEHYDNSVFRGKESFQIVYVDIKKPKNTRWEIISKEEVINILEVNIDEFEINNNDFERIKKISFEFEHLINPHKSLPLLDQFKVIERQLKIESNKLSKSNLFTIISKKKKERAIQEILKKDLSIFGELYSLINNYICFSEFPIGNKIVDFVVFSGISRMDVYLIEIKGADFNTVNKGHYSKLSSKIEIAIQQNRQTLGVIAKDYDFYRKYFHDIRIKAESGEKLYNSYLCPDRELQVDSNKDITVIPIVIGGITHDDYLESTVRHQYELSSQPKVKVESWNSFLRKVNRQ